jgi:hypothetical protein
MAPHVADLMAKELGHDHTWQKQQVEEFERVATGFVANS